MRKINHLLWLLTVGAALVLGLTYYLNVMLLQDGGWYTYPAYAILMGGDPSENLPGYAITQPHAGITAKFLWENRTNLFVLHQWLGLELTGDHWQGIRAVGAFEWLAIAALASFITAKLSRSWQAAAVVGVVVLSDSILVASALSNARPDVVNALLGLMAFGAVEWTRRTGAVTALGAAIATAVALPLMHVTSAIAISLVGIYILLSIADQYRQSRSIDAPILKLLVIGALLGGLYVLRNPILDHLIPTQVPQQLEAAGQHNLFHKLRDNFSHGGDKVAMEVKRWVAYFVVKNLSHLAFLLSGLFLVFQRGHGTSPSGALARRIMLTVIGATVFQLLTDPHPTSAHLIVIMVFAYLATGLAWHAQLSRHTQAASYAGMALAIMLTATLALKIGQSYKVHKDYAGHDFTNAKVEAGLAKVLSAYPADTPVKIQGPTELWPYLTGLNRPLTIIDIDRTQLPANVHEVFANQVALLAINEDYWNSGWAPLIQQWLDKGQIRPVLQFGTCSPKTACLSVFEPVPAH